jgi:hypothetical protein
MPHSALNPPGGLRPRLNLRCHRPHFFRRISRVTKEKLLSRRPLNAKTLAVKDRSQGSCFAAFTVLRPADHWHFTGSSISFFVPAVHGVHGGCVNSDGRPAPRHTQSRLRIVTVPFPGSIFNSSPVWKRLHTPPSSKRSTMVRFPNAAP